MSAAYSEKSHVGMALCFVCNEPKEIVLHRRLQKTLPCAAVYDKEPCSKCKEHMNAGIILISIDEQLSTDLQNPYRTGGWVVVTEDALKRLVNSQELLDHILKARMAFLPDDAWDLLKLPRGGANIMSPWRARRLSNKAASKAQRLRHLATQYIGRKRADIATAKEQQAERYAAKASRWRWEALRGTRRT